MKTKKNTEPLKDPGFESALKSWRIFKIMQGH